MSITVKYGTMPYFLPKINVSFRARDVEAWKRMLYSFMDDTQSWFEHCHMRSISQCVNSMMKRKMSFKIRKILPQLKGTEEILKINMQNLRQYSYLKHTNPNA